MMKDLGYGAGYAYDHDVTVGFSGQECLPQGMEGTTFYKPGNNPERGRARMVESALGQQVRLLIQEVDPR